MKNMKRACALIFALVMIISLAVPAYAADEAPAAANPGSITLNGVHEGQTYKIYKMLDLKSYSENEDGSKNYNYTIEADSPWLAFFQTGSGAKWVTLEAEKDEVTGNEYYNIILNQVSGAVSEEQLALDAITYAKSHNIDPTASETINQVSTFTFSNLELGYYLIDSTVGALCGLTNVDPDASVNVKNNPPVPEKEVQENSTGEYGEQNDAYIGATVNFQTTFKKEAGAQNYVVHDIMSDGLTLNQNSFKVTYTVPGGSEVPMAANTYTITFNVEHKDAEGNVQRVCDFEIVFDNNAMRSMSVGSEVKITYSAVLNENAVVDGPNPNEAYMTYGDDNETAHDTTNTFTWSFGLYKYHQDSLGAEAPLAGAKFSVYPTEPVWDANGTVTNNVQAMPWIYVGDIDTTINDETVAVPTYRIASRAEQEDDTITKTDVVTTTDVGYIKFIGLDSGDYFVREIEAPAGYSVIEGLIRIDITSDGTVSYNNTSFPGDYVKILNTTGAALPETGGMGTTLIYIFGSLMMVGAAVLLITKRRMAQ